MRPQLNDSFLLTMAFVISTAMPSMVLSADVATRRLSEERHRALIEHANDIVATLDLDLRFTSVSPAIERILGFAPAEVIGRSLRRHVPQEQLRTHAEMLNRKLKGAPSTQYEVEVLTKVGVRRVLEVNSKLIADATGKPVAIHAIARDITARKEAKRAEAHIAELDHRRTCSPLWPPFRSTRGKVTPRWTSSSAPSTAAFGRWPTRMHC